MKIDIGKFLKKVADDNEENLPDPNQTGMLKQLNYGYSNMYAGTANPIKVAQRRAKNKMARQSRRRNRK